MSDDNTPKLRLKPKLAAEAVNTPQPAATPPAPVENPPPPPAPVEEPKSFRLKPKLAADPVQNVTPVAPPTPPEAPAGNFPPPSSVTVPESPMAEEPPVANLPESTEDVSAQEFSSHAPTAAHDEPVPAPDYTDPDDHSDPTDPDTRRALTARPFPPPPANFPAPTVGGVKTVPPWSRSGKPVAAPKKKNNALIVGGVFAVLVVLVGLFIAYRKFTTPPPQPAPQPRVVAPQKQPEAAHEVTSDKTVSTTPQETAPAIHPTDSDATKTVETPVVPEPEPVAPPPDPSPEFKAWVENLKVGGVRAGTHSNARVFIGGVAYAAGETVNSQLGIIFESYNSETRRLTFVDKTGAKVERRN